MFRGRNADWSILSLATGAVMILASMGIASVQPDRARLGADVTSRSRGNNQGGSLLQKSCSALNLNTPCSDPSKVAGSTCATCTTTNYTSSSTDASSSYQNATGAGTAPCGNNVAGTCSATRTNCTPRVPQVVLGQCQKAPDVLLQP